MFRLLIGDAALKERIRELELTNQVLETKLQALEDVCKMYRQEIQAAEWGAAGKAAESELFAKVTRSMTTSAVLAAIRGGQTAQ